MRNAGRFADAEVKKSNKRLKRFLHTPEYMPASVGLEGQIQPKTIRAPSDVGFAESFTTAFDLGIDVKDKIIDDIATEMPTEPMPSNVARSWLLSAKYYKPRASKWPDVRRSD